MSVIDELRHIVGVGGFVSGEALDRYVREWRDRVRGKPLAVVRPADVETVQRLVRLAAERGFAIVPQGGNTGLCGGAIADSSGEQLVVSTERMNRIRAVAPEDNVIVAEAGCILADVQAAAASVDRLFPLSLASEGTATIGGNVSTNAGGINVVRYGTAREQVLGLEVVLPDGGRFDGLSALRKNTAGYDLKQLFVGAEGTLGIITAAALKLYPAAGREMTAMLALDDHRRAIDVLNRLRDALGNTVSAFELMSDRALNWVCRHIPDTRHPFDGRAPWYALLSVSAAQDCPLEEPVTRVLQRVTEAELVVDALVAMSEKQRHDLWRLRHSISAAQKFEGASLKHDIAVPTAAIAAFVDAAESAVQAALPGTRSVVFGHVGDGNLHYNLSRPGHLSDAAFLERAPALTRAVYECAIKLGGTISAEHGIGSFKKGDLETWGDSVALGLMRTIKRAIDPHNRMNPGKILDVNNE